MADIRAFRAHRYDLGRVGNLSDVIAPPYDVIDPALQQALYDRSPYNVIRLILNKEAPADTETDNRYTRSAAVLRDWLRDDVLDAGLGPLAVRLPPGLRGRGPTLHPQGLPGPRPPGAVRRAAASTRTRRRWPAPRPTGSSCSTPPA